VLRPVRPEDRDEIFAAFTPAVTRLMSPAPPEAPDDTARFLRDTQARMERGEEVVFAVRARADDRLLGCAGVHELRSALPELGIWIREDAWGRGLGFEAVKAVHGWARRAAPATAFRYPVDARNAASRRIAERLGGVVHGGPEPSRTADDRLLQILEYRIPLDPPPS